MGVFVGLNNADSPIPIVRQEYEQAQRGWFVSSYRLRSHC